MIFISKSKYCFGWDVHIILGENKRIVNIESQIHKAFFEQIN